MIRKDSKCRLQIYILCVTNIYDTHYDYFFSIIYYRCISADVPDNLAIGTGTYKMFTMQPSSSPPKTDLVKGNFMFTQLM